MGADTSLAPVESVRLAELEAIVDRGLQTFVEVGNALMEIRDARLYRENHATFDAYCRERFGFSDSRGRQLIAAAKTVTAVTVAGLPAPKTEREARRLARHLRVVDDDAVHDDDAVPDAVPDDDGKSSDTTRPTPNARALDRINRALWSIEHRSSRLDGDDDYWDGQIERARRVATPDEIAELHRSAKKTIASLSRFRRAIREPVGST